MNVVRVETTTTVEYEGAWHGPGSVLTVTTDQALAWKAARKAKDRLAEADAALQEKREAGAVKETDPAEKPVGDALTAAIVAAIDTLDPETGFTKSGVPEVKALERSLGYAITASERGAAVAALKAAAG